MTQAARSSFVFGIYLVALGLAIMVVPDLVLAPFGFPPTSEVWLPFLFLSLVAFVLFGLAPPQLILFGVLDLLGALWTFLALRSR